MTEPMNEEVEHVPDPKIVDFPDDVDPQLATWLNRFDAWKMSIDVTLTVDGFLVSGTPGSFADYLRETGYAFEAGMSQAKFHNAETGEVTLKSFSDLGKKLRDSANNAADDIEIPHLGATYPDDASREKGEAARSEILRAPRQHVFLKNVVINTPAGDTISVRFWRGRLSHVSGWFFGRPSHMTFEAVDG